MSTLGQERAQHEKIASIKALSTNRAGSCQILTLLIAHAVPGLNV